MYIFLSILIAVLAILLILVVTIQESKGGGLASGFASSNSIMGVQRTTNAIEKITWWLAGLLALLCVICTHWAPKTITPGTSSQEHSVISDYVKKADSPTSSDALPFSATPATSNDVGTADQTVPASSPVEQPK